MLICGIIDELTKSNADTTNMSFCFCRVADSRFNTATAVLRGFIYSLVEKWRSLFSYVGNQYD